MAWALLIRWLVRIAVSLFAWRLATRRRAYAPNGPGVRGTMPRRGIDPQRAVLAVREGASLSWRLAAAAVFSAAAIVLITAGLTTTVLSPRWLGALLLALAVGSVFLAVLEARRAAMLVVARRRRRRDQRLRRQVS